jgi:hypothetical protein
MTMPGRLDIQAFREVGALWDDLADEDIVDDADLDYQPPAPTHDRYGRPFVRQCADCYGSPATVDEDGNVGLFCEVCEHRRLRRNG